MNKTFFKLKYNKFILISLTILFISVRISEVNYLLFHTFVELITIAVMWALFIILLNTVNENQEKAIIFLAIAYLFIGMIDLFHTIAYRGMMIISNGDDANPATQLWIAARYMESISLFLFPFLFHRRVRTRSVFAGYTLITTVIFLMIFVYKIFPTCFIEGIGLTSFKKTSEYIISIILLASLYLVYIKRDHIDPVLLKYYVLSIIVTIVSELLFTFYISVYGISNLFGHLLKLLSVYFVYKALIYTGLRKPYTLLNKAIIDGADKYQQMFEKNKAIKLLIDVSNRGTLIEANQAACEFYGYSKQELSKMSITDLDTQPDDKVLALLRKAQNKDSEILHVKHRLKSGAIRDLELFIGPVKTERALYLYTIIIDNTEKLLAEERIRVSEEKYRRIADNVTDVVWVTDLHLKPTYISPSVERIIGITPEEFLQLPITSTYPPSSIEKFKKILSKELEREQTPNPDYNRIFEFEVERFFSDGTIGWDAIRANFIRDPQNNPIALLGVSRDITKRVKIEEALQQSEYRFKALHNASFGGIAIHDQGIILETNQGLSEISGFSYTELLGMDGLLLIAEQYRKSVLNNILLGYEKSYEVYGIRKNGEQYPLRLEARNIPYKGKRVRVVEFRDLTEQKQAEDENKRLHEQLVQSQKMDAIGRLAGGVAHDFNNMLGVIIGYAEFILEKIDTSNPVHEDVGEILKAATRSADLTQQLLAFSRKQTIVARVLDINENIEDTLNMLRKLIGEDIDLIWLPSSLKSIIRFDPSQLNQILVNLCINAKDAIEKSGRITIKTKNISVDRDYSGKYKELAKGDYVLLSFSDNGSGMEEETVDKIFEPFFSQKGAKGTGLGMATVYGIVKQNKGFINVSSVIGKGTTINIYFSKYVGETDIQLPRTQEGLYKGQGQTILLVEDEKIIREMVQSILERLGYQVLVAETPTAAISFAETQKDSIALLLTDVIMPDMNGRDLSVKIQQICPSLQTLYMSGYTDNVIAPHGVLEQGTHFIQKPFSLKDLGTKIYRLLHNQSTD